MFWKIVKSKRKFSNKSIDDNIDFVKHYNDLFKFNLIGLNDNEFHILVRESVIHKMDSLNCEEFIDSIVTI